ncbi:MAG: hypothetical protein KatS3mg111_1082 [Pirellulaceae bacterium]|nr:MAG: hypothetical protein KatS3mg111_1082 [Pirellulaceae bacterium]
MQDYTISKCTRKCAISGRNLMPGEAFVSMVVPDGETFRRLDISQEHWNGPSEQAIGWWTNRMPEAGAKRLKPAPDGVLLDALSGLIERPGKEVLAYLLALLLVRRRVLVEDPQAEFDDQPAPVWRLISPGDGRLWEVPMVSPTAETMPVWQDELKALLFTEE